MARLTVKDVEAKRASADRREIPDDYMRGLYLIVQPTGTKSWAVRYRLPIACTALSANFLIGASRTT